MLESASSRQETSTRGWGESNRPYPVVGEERGILTNSLCHISQPGQPPVLDLNREKAYAGGETDNSLTAASGGTGIQNRCRGSIVLLSHCVCV